MGFTEVLALLIGHPRKRVRVVVNRQFTSPVGFRSVWSIGRLLPRQPNQPVDRKVLERFLRDVVIAPPVSGPNGPGSRDCLAVGRRDSIAKDQNRARDEVQTSTADSRIMACGGCNRQPTWPRA